MVGNARIQDMPDTPRQRHPTHQTRRTILKILIEITLSTKTAQKPINKATTFIRKRLKW